MNRAPAAGFANEAHQLLVSVSRHLYVTGRGLVKYQEKPMEAVTSNLLAPGKSAWSIMFCAMLSVAILYFKWPLPRR